MIKRNQNQEILFRGNYKKVETVFGNIFQKKIGKGNLVYNFGIAIEQSAAVEPVHYIIRNLQKLPRKPVLKFQNIEPCYPLHGSFIPDVVFHNNRATKNSFYFNFFKTFTYMCR